MTKNKIFLVFFSFLFVFCASASSVCTPQECEEFKDTAIGYISNISDSFADIYNLASHIDGLAQGGNNPAGIIVAVDAIHDIYYSSSSTANQLYHFVDRVDCNSCSNGTCSVDLYPVVSVLSNIVSFLELERNWLYNISKNSDAIRLTLNEFNARFANVSVVGWDGAWVNVRDSELLSSVSNLVYNIDLYHNSTTNYLRLIRNSVYEIEDNTSNIFTNLEDYLPYLYDMTDLLTDIDALMITFSNYIQAIQINVRRYLCYLETISNDLKYISTNGVVSVDQSFTNLFHYSSLLGFDRFRYYAQGQNSGNLLQLYPLSPYDNLQNLRNATIYDAVAAGFESLLISQGSINNYLYWLKAIAGSNRLESVDNHISAVSNLVGRLDDYVLVDFSNEVVKISDSLSYLTNRVDYTTNFVHLAELVETNNVFLSSIDSKLDVLDYIKILSTTPLSGYSGDSDYFEYLTNLYINGSVDSGGVSTNWFERMEILLASLVFGDSDGTNGIPQGVEMEGFDSQTFENALTDYTFTDQFTSAVGNIETTSHNFMQILNGYHSAIKNVSKPASVSIGLFGIDTGSDTTTFEQLLDHSFQVSFDVGTTDRFTVVVRAVTTICWVLLTLIFIWHCGFWICSKIQFFYRLMRLLINSIWLRS